MFPSLTPPRHLFLSTLIIFGVLLSSRISSAAPQVTLTWRDNSINEDGFVIERRPSTGGTYTPVAQVGQNVTSYIDNTVVAGSGYCYRVQSFNNGGSSPYSNEACGSVATQDTLESVSVSVFGQGSVVSNPTGISCAPTCAKGFPRGTTGGLTATPGAGWQFQGWGGSCAGQAKTCSLVVDQVKNVTANFVKPSGGGGGGATTNPTIGTFRSGAWWIDNGNWIKDGCTVDTCGSFGVSGDLPVVGYWTKGGEKQIGVFRQGTWYLDSNGNGRFDSCTGGDTCFSFGSANQKAVVGDVNGDGQAEVGVFSDGEWYLDTGNRRWDGCTIDTCISGFGLTGDQPVMGDWNGDGRSEIGVFRNGSWYFDYNGNRKWDGCGVDKCLSFGERDDRPVVGDWNGDRKTQIGVLRGSEWYLDNGDGVWTSCTVDKCVQGLESKDDIPVSR